MVDIIIPTILTVIRGNMKAAYADPPYPGQAKKHYADQPICKEVNHRLLIGTLCESFDCWALSTSSTALQQVLELCPPDVRIGAWVKPFAVFKPNVNPAYAWEPVVLRHGGKLGRDVPTVRDWCAANITLKTGLSGAKPREFCNWLFEFMGLSPADEFVDVFPGSGAVTSAWEAWKAARHGQFVPVGLFADESEYFRK